MTIEDLKKIILLCIKKKKIPKDDWDSLSHLAILLELEKKIPKKIDKIKNLSNATNYNKILKALSDHKVIKK